MNTGQQIADKSSWSEIHRVFLDFFAGKSHAIVPSSSLVPEDDPTLLFTNAGMVQFKNVFLGLEKRPYSSAATIQKCMRVSGKHNDIKQVGPSPRHHSFFLMLGNFSFGDYFKEEAIGFAWEFLTEVLRMPKDRFHFTVYKDDKESEALWHKIARASLAKIHKMGEKTNFWMMGDVGPCGPNTELIWDRGPGYCTCGRADCFPHLDNDCDRWWEVWNLVFMQYEQRKDGGRMELPKPGVDTGMGFERLVAILQSAKTNYDTDLFQPIMQKIRELRSHDADKMREELVAYRVLADHSRAVAFLLADNVIPGNEGRSYVLRMIMRRAVRFGKRLGFEGAFLGELARVVIELMGDHYGKLVERKDFILKAIRQEEERFERTLSEGVTRLDQLIAALKREGQTEVPGDEVFRLYDTYGFPLEMTQEIAAEQGLSIDLRGFHDAMRKQRETSKEASVRIGASASLSVTATVIRSWHRESTEFVGYENLEAEAEVVGVEEETDRIHVVFSRTPFYARAGGQVGDTGTAENLARHGQAVIYDTVRHEAGATLHYVRITSGQFRTGDRCRLIVDEARRKRIARNHTATHILHKALREVLGDHVIQAGSLVLDEELRFDFSHFEKVTDQELACVEDLANAIVLQDLPVKTGEMPLDEAKASGAVAHFEEEYKGKDLVRVVSVGKKSRELCGGTHVTRSGEIGLIKIISEESIGAGTRRIRAVTGDGALKHLRACEDLLERLKAELGEQPLEGLSRLREETAFLRARLHEMTETTLREKRDELLAGKEQCGNVFLVSGRLDMGVDELKHLADLLEEKARPAVVLLVGNASGRAVAVCKASKKVDALDARTIVRAMSAALGGGGGGNRTFGQGGGPEVSQLNEALENGIAAARAVLTR